MRNPDLYHGNRVKRNFFEGWYFKLVDENNNNAISIIPGIFKGNKKQYSHSFIQVLDGNNVDYRYLKFESNLFNANSNEFKISIDNNMFSLEGIHIDIERDDFSIKGELEFHSVFKWPDSALNPGSMGFYNYILFMQCYSQVCALDMKVNGKLIVNGREIIFNNSKGYIEKNWGKAFPYSWIWIQANCFSNETVALSVSIGHIPFITGSFRGFLIGLRVNDRFYSFTTINKSKLKIVKKRYDVHIYVENDEHILDIDVDSEKSTFMMCMGPRDNDMVPLVKETLKAKVSILLKDKKTEQVIFAGESLCGGVEYGGTQMLILNDK